MLFRSLLFCVPMLLTRLNPCVPILATTHIETVCALSKLNAKQHIEVEIKTDELDLTAAESKATYEEIREYVKEHTGLNVSDLYIAPVSYTHLDVYKRQDKENYL